MNDVEFGPIPPNAGRRLARRWAAGAALIAIAFAGSSCSMIDQFNPFGSEKYKMEITPDTPASMSAKTPGSSARAARPLGRRRGVSSPMTFALIDVIQLSS